MRNITKAEWIEFSRILAELVFFTIVFSTVTFRPITMLAWAYGGLALGLPIRYLTARS